MVNQYLEDTNTVSFSVKSEFNNIDEKIVLPLSLVEDLQSKMVSYGIDSEHAFNTLILVAFDVYMDYVNGDLVKLDFDKKIIEKLCGKV